MNILYISTVFPREQENSTIYTDLAEALVECGHQVTVLVAEEKKKCNTCGLNMERGCRVWRVKTGNMYDVNIIEKGITYITLECYLKRTLVKELKHQKFDLILFEAPPVTLSSVVAVAKKMYHAPAFLMMKDIFPQNAVDIGLMRKNSLVYRYFKNKEKKLYAIADHIGCMSKGNCRYLQEHDHVSQNKLSVFPNTKKIHPIPPKDLSVRDKYGIPRDKVVFVFGGNMGKPQGMEFLANAIKKAESIKQAFFVLVGRGTEKEKVRSILKNSHNVLILDNLYRMEYEKLISSCDVGIVSLDYRFTIPNYPSRVLSYMEYGMPVLAVTDENTDFRQLIKDAECGYWCNANDKENFINIVKKFCNSKKTKMGESGRKYIEKHFDINISIRLLEEYIKNRNRSI